MHASTHLPHRGYTFHDLDNTQQPAEHSRKKTVGRAAHQMHAAHNRLCWANILGAFFLLSQPNRGDRVCQDTHVLAVARSAQCTKQATGNRCNINYPRKADMKAHDQQQQHTAALPLAAASEGDIVFMA